MGYLRQKKLIANIETEFDEPIKDVLQGFSDMGFSYCTVAKVLGTSPDTMARLRDKCGVKFPKNTRPEVDPETREKIASTKRKGLRKDAVLLTFKGRTQHLSAWARELDVPVGTLWGRLNKYGMSVTEAFTRRPHLKRLQGKK